MLIPENLVGMKKSEDAPYSDANLPLAVPDQDLLRWRFPDLLYKRIGTFHSLINQMRILPER